MQVAQHPHRTNPASLAPLGYALVVISLLAIVALLHHPIGHGRLPDEMLESIRSQARMDRLVHATLALVFGFLAAAMAVFAGRLGLRRFTVAAGLVAFSFASVLTLLATMTDGFVIPAIAARCTADVSPACTTEAVSLLRLCAAQIEYLTRFSLVAVAIAVAAWSAALLSTPLMPRWAGCVGLASAAGQGAGLLAASGRLVPATLLFILAAQVIWYLLVAVLMIQDLGPFGKGEKEGVLF